MLVVTIHDVAPPMLAAAIELRELAGRWGAVHTTLLAIPNFHGVAPLAAHAPTIDWLRRRADAGDEIALHGLRHVQAAPAGALGALRARVLTAGEAEMLGAGAADPSALARARDELEELARTPIRGFVAPAWLEPSGFGDVLARIGFDWHETSLVIERLCRRSRDGLPGSSGGGAIVSPVIGFATRSRWRTGASLAWAAMTVPVIARLASVERPARIALHPADLGSRRVLAAAERAVRRLGRAHASVTTAVALGVARA